MLSPFSPDLMVTIVPTYTPPPDVDLGPNEYRAATTLTLTCMVEGASRTVSYQWMTSFEGDEDLTTPSITRDQLRPQENGTHTCTATDGDGVTGSGSIEVIVVGELS